jgi:hypothetical protein
MSAERQVRLPCVRALCCYLQGLLTADPTLADGFKRTRFLVLDEADRLLEPTFQVRIDILFSIRMRHWALHTVARRRWRHAI